MFEIFSKLSSFLPQTLWAWTKQSEKVSFFGGSAHYDEPGSFGVVSADRHYFLIFDESVKPDNKGGLL